MRMRRQLVIGENTTYPIPLLEKQSPRLLQHLSIGFLLAHIGVKVGRVGMHLFYPPRDDLSTRPKPMSSHHVILFRLSYHVFSYREMSLKSVKRVVLTVTRQKV